MLESNFVELGITYFLAAMMPGPSVALIIKNGMLYSRMASLQACLGTIVGTALQSGIVLMGLTFIDNNSIFFKTIRVLCSLYLIYLGLKVLLSKRTNEALKCDASYSNATSLKRYREYFFEGFLIEFLNPLAFTFFISIMTVVVSSQEAWFIKISYWIEIIILAFIWFFSVAFLLSSEKLTVHTKKFNRILEMLAGGVFIFFGSKMFMH